MVVEFAAKLPRLTVPCVTTVVGTLLVTVATALLSAGVVLWTVIVKE